MRGAAAWRPAASLGGPHATSAIMPTWRAVGAMAAGVPVALACGMAAEGLWVAGPAWILAVLAAMAADALALRPARAFGAEAVLPAAIETGGGAEAVVRFTGRRPPRLEVALEVRGPLDASPARQVLPRSGAAVAFSLVPRRRGTATVARVHLCWAGPLGLVSRVEARPVGRDIPVIPAISLAREEALRLLSRSRGAGQAVQRERSDDGAFHALRGFQRGDDPRRVHWRQSARHAALLVRDTQAERNRTIMLGLDTGRLMSAPLAGGLPRLDHALNAALVLALVGLKMGDRVGLFAFGARPVLATGALGGTAAFAALQAGAAALEYSEGETNFTLGLSGLDAVLGGRTLDKRALVVVFTDFDDAAAASATGADLMLENVRLLLQRHAVLFVTFRDDLLHAMAEAEPATVDDVSRAVVAGTLLAGRAEVLARLRRLGATVVETPARQAGLVLVSRYLDLMPRVPA